MSIEEQVNLLKATLSTINTEPLDKWVHSAEKAIGEIFGHHSQEILEFERIVEACYAMGEEIKMTGENPRDVSRTYHPIFKGKLKALISQISTESNNFGPVAEVNQKNKNTKSISDQEKHDLFLLLDYSLSQVPLADWIKSATTELSRAFGPYSEHVIWLENQDNSFTIESASDEPDWRSTTSTENKYLAIFRTYIKIQLDKMMPATKDIAKPTVNSKEPKVITKEVVVTKTVQTYNKWIIGILITIVGGCIPFMYNLGKEKGESKFDQDKINFERLNHTMQDTIKLKNDSLLYAREFIKRIDSLAFEAMDLLPQDEKRKLAKKYQITIWPE